MMDVNTFLAFEASSAPDRAPLSVLSPNMPGLIQINLKQNKNRAKTDNKTKQKERTSLKKISLKAIPSPLKTWRV